MIKDITIGQYFPGRSAVHRMDPRVKLMLTITFIVMLFIVKNPIGFILCGFNHRFGWHTLPRPVVMGATILFLLAYALYAEVLRENMWLSRTIEVQENQKVVDTGLYGIVRHPMYAVTLLLFLSMPLVLGSIHAFLVFLAYPVIIGKRLLAEEDFLEEHLPGYREYKQKVRYRLLPFIW